MSGEFSVADKDGDVSLPTVVSQSSDLSQVDNVEGVMKFRSELVKSYHQGAVSLLDRMERNGCNSTEQLVMEMIREVIRETDNLLGNQLIATQNGNLRDASIISSKRAEVFQSAIKAMQTKQAMEKDGSIGLDVNSPSMTVVFRFFMSKVRSILMSMNFDSELSDTFFRMFKDVMKDWRKELTAEIAANSGGVNIQGEL